METNPRSPELSRKRLKWMTAVFVAFVALGTTAQAAGLTAKDSKQMEDLIKVWGGNEPAISEADQLGLMIMTEGIQGNGATTGKYVAQDRDAIMRLAGDPDMRRQLKFETASAIDQIDEEDEPEESNLETPSVNASNMPAPAAQRCSDGKSQVQFQGLQGVQWGTRTRFPAQKFVIMPNVQGLLRQYPVQENVPGFCDLDRDKSLVPLVARIACEVGGTFIVVNSAYRPKAHNAKVGGKKKSFHQQCLALDFRVFEADRSSKNGLREISVKSVRRSAIQVARKFYGEEGGGVGFYPNFVHFDLGPKRRWRGPGYAGPMSDNGE